MINNNIPEVGKGATVSSYSDSYAYQVLEVSKDGKTVIIEEMDASCPGGQQMGEQRWTLSPSGRKTTVVYKNGSWKIVGSEIIFEESFRKSLPSPSKPIALQMSEELKKEVYGDNVLPVNVVPGVTKRKKTYNKIKIVFGVMQHYYDWSF